MEGGCNKSKSSDCPPTKKRAKNRNSSSSKKGPKYDKSGCTKTKSKACQGFGKKTEENKCGVEKDEFGRELCPKEAEPPCHETRKRFFQDNKCDKRDENTCDDKSDEDTCDEREEPEEETECQDETKKQEGVCGKEKKSSKKKGCNKNFAKRYVQFEPKPKQYLTVDEDEGLKMPEPQVMTVRPCLPKLERSKKRFKACSSSISTAKDCGPKGNTNMCDFFLIDARNMKMNECIKQHVKSDPSQINILCAQLIKKRIHTDTHSPIASVCGCGHQSAHSPHPIRAGLIPQKYTQFVRRWAPTAGMYAAATAIVTVWVTEWDEVLKRIPFYKPQEETIGQRTLPPPPEGDHIPDEDD